MGRLVLGATLPGTSAVLWLQVLPKHLRPFWESMTSVLVYPVVAVLLNPTHPEVKLFYPVCR